MVDIHDTLCKKPKLDKCSKIDDFSKEFISIWWDNYNSFIIHLRWKVPSTWAIPIHFQAIIERWHSGLGGVLGGTFVTCIGQVNDYFIFNPPCLNGVFL